MYSDCPTTQRAKVLLLFPKVWYMDCGQLLAEAYEYSCPRFTITSHSAFASSLSSYIPSGAPSSQAVEKRCITESPTLSSFHKYPRLPEYTHCFASYPEA